MPTCGTGEPDIPALWRPIHIRSAADADDLSQTNFKETQYMKSNIINLNSGKVYVDPRYGKVIALDTAEAVPLQKLDIAYAVVRPGATSPAHYHEFTEEVYVIVQGSGIVTIDGVATQVASGDVVRIPCFAVHSIRAGEDGCEFWVSTSPPYCEADDIETDAVSMQVPSANVRKIAVIVGTHRRESVSGKIARQVAALYRELGIEIDLIDLGELPESIFGSDSYESRYDPTTPLAQRFIAARALHVLTPEYNGSFPAPLKHALDIVPYKECFDGKPVALVGVAAGALPARSAARLDPVVALSKR